MDKNERNLIKNLISGGISKQDFIRQYPVDFDSDKNYVLNGLKDALSKKTSEDVEDFLSLVTFDKGWNTNPKYANIFCELLGESWHYQHEDLVSLLQGMKDPDTVDCLYNSALAKPEYMDYDDSYSLARKCIHALGDINTDYAREKLRLLAQSSNPIIKEKAEKQLNADNKI
jgi:hypothetical protein